MLALVFHYPSYRPNGKFVRVKPSAGIADPPFDFGESFSPALGVKIAQIVFS
jgi:hypothetical protein